MRSRRRIGAALCAALALAAPTIAQAKTWEVASDTTNAGQRLTNALLNAQNGDRIHVQSPGPYFAPPGGWRIKRSVELFGDGAGKPVFQDPKLTSTILRPASTNDPVLVLDLSEVPKEQSLWSVYVHDLQISQTVNVPAPAGPMSNGIYLKITENKTVGNLRLARLFIYGMGHDGIHLEGKDGRWDPVGVVIEDCSSVYNRRHGLLAFQVNQLDVRGGAYGGNWHKGASLQSCPVAHVSGTAFESNEKPGCGLDSLAAAQLFVEGCGGFQVSGCHFEAFNNRGGSTTAVTINSPGGYIGENYFASGASPGSQPHGSVGIYLGWESRSIVVGANEWCDVDKLVEIADLPTTTSCTIMPQNVAPKSVSESKLVVPDAPDRGHLMVVPTAHGSNLTAGWALPRLSKKVRDGMTPLAAGGTLRRGLLIFNESTGKLNFYDGKMWRELTDAPATP
jgi:hypothetical protein